MQPHSVLVEANEVRPGVTFLYTEIPHDTGAALMLHGRLHRGDYGILVEPQPTGDRRVFVDPRSPLALIRFVGHPDLMNVEDWDGRPTLGYLSDGDRVIEIPVWVLRAGDAVLVKAEPSWIVYVTGSGLSLRVCVTTITAYEAVCLQRGTSYAE